MLLVFLIEALYLVRCKVINCAVACGVKDGVKKRSLISPEEK